MAFEAIGRGFESLRAYWALRRKAPVRPEGFESSDPAPGAQGASERIPGRGHRAERQEEE